MRMWNVNPKQMCDQHILGEHVEMHMFVGTINKGISIKGYLENGLIEPHNIVGRHQELVEEMERRGMKHNSELPKLLEEPKIEGRVNSEDNQKLLAERCKICRERIVGVII